MNNNSCNELGFWGFPTGKFLPYMVRMTGLNENALKKKIPTIYKYYKEGVQSGLKPFEVDKDDTYEILYYIMDKTFYPYDEILSFLVILSTFAKDGEIDINWYIPEKKDSEIMEKLSNFTKITGIGTAVLLAGATMFGIGYFLKQLK